MRTGHLEELAIVIFGGQINLAGASLDVLLHGREVDTTRSVVQRRCHFRCTTLRRRDSVCATTRSVVQRRCTWMTFRQWKFSGGSCDLGFSLCDPTR